MDEKTICLNCGGYMECFDSCDSEYRTELLPEVNPEVCIVCGKYFNFQGGEQVCGVCCRK